MIDNKTNYTNRIIAKKYRNGEKYITVVIDYLDEFGKRKQKSLGTGIPLKQYQRDGKKKVEQIRQEFLEQFSKDYNKELQYATYDMLNPDKITLFEYLKFWQEGRKNKISISHWDYGNMIIERLQEFIFTQMNKRDIPLKYFNYKMLIAFYENQKKRLVKWSNEPISNKTLKHCMTYLNTAFRDAYKKDFIPFDIVKRVEMPKVEPHEKRYLEQDAFLKLMNMPNENRKDALVKLDALTGLRTSELLGLKFKDIDITNTLHVQRKVLYSAKRGFVISSEMKTKSSKRKIVLNEFMIEQLDWLKNNINKNKEHLDNLYKTEYAEFICVNEFGELYRPAVLQRYMHSLCRKLDVPYCNFHGLRHTCATILSLSGASAKEAQDQLGHSNYSTTMDIYTGLWDSQRVDTSNRTAQFIKNSLQKDTNHDENKRFRDN